jgi:hypothetical protein
MLIQSWGDVFQTSLQGLWYGFVATFPVIVLAVVIFILGWIVATTLGHFITIGVDKLKLDKLFHSAGVQQILDRAGWKLHIGGILGWLVKWFIVIAFLIASLETLQLTQVTLFLQDILKYLPNIVIAVFILVAGGIFANVARKITIGSAAIAGLSSAKIASSIAYYAIWVVAIVTALDKLGIFGYFGQVLFTGIVIMLALAFGLAFGLGGKDAAARWINRLSDDFSSKG